MYDDMEDAVMTRKIFLVLVAGLFIGLLPGAVFADGPSHDDYVSPYSSMSSGSSSTVEADMWSSSGPVETGAVPSLGGGDPNNDRIPPESTHFDSFNPDRRVIDLGGGGE